MVKFIVHKSNFQCIQGSTPDRGHVWGSDPYGAADRVPSLSHWVHDVVSYYHCCLWTERVDLCRLYMDLRPTPDCSTYDVPGIGGYWSDPPENCYLNVKKLPILDFFFQENCQKFSFFFQKIANGNFLENMTFFVNFF